MGFQGSLDTVGLTDIFQLFGFGRKSGALHLRNHAEHGVIHFDRGDVFYATMNPSEAVGNLLVRAELVTPEQWKLVLDEAASGQPQGEVLVAVEGVDTVAVEVFLRERVEDAVFRLAQWDGGEFELIEDAHPFGAAFRFETEPLLATAERRMAEWRRITAVVPSVSMGVQLVRDLPSGQGEVTLGTRQWRIVAAVTPGCDVADVAAGLGDTEFRTCETLAAMVEAGLVDLVAEDKLAAIRALLGAAPPATEPTPEPAAFEPPVVAEPEHEPAPPVDDAPKLSLAELAAAAAEEPPPPAETGFSLGDLAAEYPPPEPAPEPAPEPVVAPYLDTVTPPPAVYTPSFDLAGPPPQSTTPLAYNDVGPPAHSPGGGADTGEVPAVGYQNPHTPDIPGEAQYGAAGIDAATLAEAATGDSELDKSLILRLIAGVKSL